MDIVGLGGLGEVTEGHDLVGWLAGCGLERGDIVVVTQKIISKAEGRVVSLASVEPSPFAQQLGTDWKRDPRQIELVLRESASIVRMERGIIISRTRHGLVCANAGVDLSNSPGVTACLLPLDPDDSARQLYEGLIGKLGFPVPVLISDSFGRAWRMGIVNVCIGLAGMSPFVDYRGQKDEHGYLLEATFMGTADQLCAAAELVMGKTDGKPAARIRGFAYEPGLGSAEELIRPASEDMFR